MDAQKDQIPEKSLKLSWDLGTAYDLMMSLEVLHNPEKFGLRASWAAGVRSRVPAGERGVLEDSLKLLYVPLPWIHSLPETKDAATALWALHQVPPVERLSTLADSGKPATEYDEILAQVSERRAWDESDLEKIQKNFKGKKSHSQKDATTVLEW